MSDDKDDLSNEPKRVNPQTRAKRVQMALEDAKGAIENAFASAGDDQVSLILAHKYLHNAVDLANTIAALKFSASSQFRDQQQQMPPLDGEDYNHHG